MTNYSLPRRSLGRTGKTVTPIGLGGAYLGVTRENGQYSFDEDTGIATVLHALDLGLNLIDTSAGYMGGSKSERTIGKALKQWFTSGGDRDDIVVSTKTGTREGNQRTEMSYSAKATWESVETSLELLGLDYLDVILIHDPRDLGPVLAPNGAWEAVKAMRDQGLVHNIGLGTRSHEFHRAIIETGDCDVSLTHSDFNLLYQTAVKGVIEPAATRGVSLFNGTSLMRGLLLGERNPVEIIGEQAESWHRSIQYYPVLADVKERAQAMWDFSQEWEVNLLALNLQYIARETRVTATMMGAASPAQIETDVAALTTELPEGIWAALKGLMAEMTHDS